MGKYAEVCKVGLCRNLSTQSLSQSTVQSGWAGWWGRGLGGELGRTIRRGSYTG